MVKEKPEEIMPVHVIRAKKQHAELEIRDVLDRLANDLQPHGVNIVSVFVEVHMSTEISAAGFAGIMRVPLIGNVSIRLEIND